MDQQDFHGTHHYATLAKRNLGAWDIITKGRPGMIVDIAFSRQDAIEIVKRRDLKRQQEVQHASQQTLF